jgi:hypothetical protein
LQPPEKRKRVYRHECPKDEEKTSLSAEASSWSRWFAYVFSTELPRRYARNLTLRVTVSSLRDVHFFASPIEPDLPAEIDHAELKLAGVAPPRPPAREDEKDERDGQP